MGIVMNPPDPFRRTGRPPNRATPGTISVARDKYGIVFYVGQLAISNRITYDGKNNLFHRCAICGHPYDHNGIAHTSARQGHIKRGEAITGPDGYVYNWDGSFWRLQP